MGDGWENEMVRVRVLRGSEFLKTRCLMNVLRDIFFAGLFSFVLSDERQWWRCFFALSLLHFRLWGSLFIYQAGKLANRHLKVGGNRVSSAISSRFPLVVYFLLRYGTGLMLISYPKIRGEKWK